MLTDSLPITEKTELPAKATLVVAVRSADAAEQLLAAIPQAQRQSASLVVALTHPRHGFTTDAAVARHVAAREHDELLGVQRIVRRLLAGTGITAEVVVVRYLSSPFASKRRRRVTAAVDRLARRRGGSVHAELPGRASAPGVDRTPSEQGGCVAAVLPDSVEAVRVAEVAAELARAAGQSLVLVVPVPEPGYSLDPIRRARAHSRVKEDAAAVSGRVRPTLDRFALTAQVLTAPYCTDGPPVRVYQSMADTMDQVCRGIDAQVVVVSAIWPALSHLRTPALLVRPVSMRTVAMAEDA